MTHPQEARIRAIQRREFLKRAGVAGLALPSLGAILAACSGDGGSNAGGSDGGGASVGPIPPARPDAPVELPIYDDNQPIANDLEPEAGPLKVYNWGDYTYKKVIKEFEAKYGVDVEVTDFAGMSEALSKIRTGAIEFDVFFPTIDVIGKLVAAKLLQPINLSYIPNLEANIWPQLQDPFFDKGSRYTVPYMTWKTGIGYRSDLLDTEPGDLDNPWNVFWDPALDGKVGLYNEYRDTIAMAIVRNGHVDEASVNTDDPALIGEAKDSLLDLASKVNPVVSTGDYQRLAEGTNYVHLQWSGNAAYTQYYLPDDVTVDDLGFWFPEDGRGNVDSDTITIGKDAKNPVLAHLYLNHLLEYDVALTNFGYEGYQPPQNDLTTQIVLDNGVIPASIESAVVKQEDFETGFRLVELAPEVDAMWQNAWAEFKSGT